MRTRMPSRLVALTIDANDPPALARFWAAVLGWEPADDPGDGTTQLRSEDNGFRIRFLPTRDRKAGRNRIHFDVTSASLQDQQQTVARSLALGGSHLDIGQRPEEGHVVLADPEGNEFCVIGPGNAFLAGCGPLGAVNCDGSRQVGCFWSEALGWPLVWDQDEETAIRSPDGGAKITWSGPPLMPRTGRDRIRFDLAPAAGGDHRAEVERLVSLGAARTAPGPDGTGAVAMTDPDGNEFRVLIAQ